MFTDYGTFYIHILVFYKAFLTYLFLNTRLLTTQLLLLGILTVNYYLLLNINITIKTKYNRYSMIKYICTENNDFNN